MRALGLLLLLLGALALPSAGAQEYVAGDHVFAFAFADAHPAVGTQQTLLIDVFHNTTGIPVGGLADALTLTLVLGDATRVFTLAESEDVVGRYSTRLLPTQAGNYTARVTGKVEGREVAVEATLPGVAAAQALEFPPVDTLGSRLDAIEARVDAKKGIPVGGALLSLAALALVALARRPSGGGR